MPIPVVNGAQMMCSFGISPAPLTVPPTKRTMIGKQPVAVIADIVPLANIGSFGMCNSLANPQVAAATSAALGVLTPMPCVPAPAGTWVGAAPSPVVGSLPIVQNNCSLNCAWGGVIQVISPGQFTTQTG
ncbi:DUF4280 domain-containing protein [Nocardioides sp. L-11A]|uniref:DUF4280 domain-containing protein n=1 Tax=Nocardioides sp. L-11A TaxID=3043848 RepID=UPI002499FE94|nr:DUF4280 domain-containing protein [Nocardioides sp. L-11A]